MGHTMKKALLFGLGLVVPNEGQRVVSLGKKGAYCSLCEAWFPRDTIVYRNSSSEIVCAPCEVKRRGSGMLGALVRGLFSSEGSE